MPAPMARRRQRAVGLAVALCLAAATLVPWKAGASPPEELRVCGPNEGGNYFADIEGYLREPATPRWTRADCKVLAPVWTGNDDRGQLFTPLWRGVAGAIEDYIPAPPGGNCANLKGTVRLDWDRAANTIHYMIKLIGLPVSPTITRVDGGDPEIADPNDPRHFVPPPQATWWYNAFHRAPKDFPSVPGNGTADRLWTIIPTFATRSAPFYYDATTLLLRGSVFDFPNGPPPNTFPVTFPIASITSSLLIYPDERGFAVREYTVAYDKVTGEGGYWAEAPTTFIPHNLCRASPNQPVLGQLRPYITPFRPVSEAAPWDTYLRQGISFDLTIEEGRPDVPPGGDDNNFDYLYSGLAFLQNVPAAQGGIPRGWSLSLQSTIQNVQPILAPRPRCGAFVNNPQVTAPLFCRGER
ncbi:MAG: hypothetical protein ACREMO_12830 [Gemmatimonadales bacterium]